MVQLQSGVQLAAGLVEVQQSPHKPEEKQKKGLVNTTVSCVTGLFINNNNNLASFKAEMLGQSLLVHLFIFAVPEGSTRPLKE